MQSMVQGNLENIKKACNLLQNNIKELEQKINDAKDFNEIQTRQILFHNIGGCRDVDVNDVCCWLKEYDNGGYGMLTEKEIIASSSCCHKYADSREIRTE